MEFGEFSPDWPEAVTQRLRALEADDARLRWRVAQVNAAVPKVTRDALLTQALKASSNAKRIMWLRREADAIDAAATPFSACSSGCSHCCHIGVMMLATEAAVIGREIGRVPVDPPADKSVMWDPNKGQTDFERKSRELTMEPVGKPCPFLSEDGCSIYAFRPLACRLQVNLDEDSLLCELVAGADIPVPYLNTSASKVAYVLAVGRGHSMADIRQFFPER